MLINEIGRFGEDIVELKASEVTQNIHPSLKQGYVGIFWHVGDNMWIIRKVKVTSDENTVEKGIDYDSDTNDVQVDYAKFHEDVWNTEIRTRVRPYKNVKYDGFSRGRIVFNNADQKFWIYVPRSEKFTDEIGRWLAAQFNIPMDGYVLRREVYTPKDDIETLGTEENMVLNY